MSDNIQDIIIRANQSLTNQEGFLNCHLRATQHVLAYVFSNGPDAETFRQQRELFAASNGLRYEIHHNEPHVVLEYR